MKKNILNILDDLKKLEAKTNELALHTSKKDLNEVKQTLRKEIHKQFK